MTDEISEHLNILARDGCYRVDAVLKKSTSETTERVFFQGSNGAELGPFVRKRIDCEMGEGAVYERLCAAQRAGRRFLHLPRVYDCHRADGCLVVVMEHVEGETLAEAVARQGASAALAERAFPQLCDAATELHEGFDEPIVHRDLKPSNVMLSRDGATLTVIDFGIARVWKEGADEDTRHFGTRAYAPPEQFGFGQTDARSDVYALGMLLYFCLTGRAPSARTRSDGFSDKRVPEAFRQVVARAAAFDPQARYASAAEAKQAFRAAQAQLEGGGAASAIPTTPADPTVSAGSSFPETGEASSSAGTRSCADSPHAGAGSRKTSRRKPDGSSADESSKRRRRGSRRADESQTSQTGQASQASEPFKKWPPDSQSPGGTYASRTAKAPGGGRPGSWRSFVDRIPLWPGVVWNIFLLLFALLLIAASVSTAFDPQPGSSLAEESFVHRVGDMICLVTLLFLPDLFFLRDRRPLRRLFPRMRPVRLHVEIVFVLGAAVACFILFCLMEALLP